MELEAAKLTESTQPALPIMAPTSNKPVIVNPTSQPVVNTETKTPKIRDVVLDQLRDVAPMGRKAANIRRYYEATYHVDIHPKTVGMTLYRLAADNLVHRKGQIWFYGAQAGQSSTATTENPGAETPGPTQLDSQERSNAP